MELATSWHQLTSWRAAPGPRAERQRTAGAAPRARSPHPIQAPTGCQPAPRGRPGSNRVPVPSRRAALALCRSCSLRSAPSWRMRPGTSQASAHESAASRPQAAFLAILAGKRLGTRSAGQTPRYGPLTACRPCPDAADRGHPQHGPEAARGRRPPGPAVGGMPTPWRTPWRKPWRCRRCSPDDDGTAPLADLDEPGTDHAGERLHPAGIMPALAPLTCPVTDALEVLDA